MFVPSGRPARRGLAAALVLAGLVLLAGCGPSNAIGIQYKGYSIQPSRSTAKAGPVVFNISNQDGQVMHQLLVVQTDTPAGALRLGADTKVDLSGMAVVAQADQVDLGQSTTLTARLAPGHYVLLCNIVGHYQLGMHADFTVTP
jgi:uncharacterized cupredoxin-like copper-binding protein